MERTRGTCKTSPSYQHGETKEKRERKGAKKKKKKES